MKLLKIFFSVVVCLISLRVLAEDAPSGFNVGDDVVLESDGGVSPTFGKISEISSGAYLWSSPSVVIDAFDGHQVTIGADKYENLWHAVGCNDGVCVHPLNYFTDADMRFPAITGVEAYRGQLLGLKHGISLYRQVDYEHHGEIHHGISAGDIQSDDRNLIHKGDEVYSSMWGVPGGVNLVVGKVLGSFFAPPEANQHLDFQSGYFVQFGDGVFVIAEDDLLPVAQAKGPCDPATQHCRGQFAYYGFENRPDIHQPGTILASNSHLTALQFGPSKTEVIVSTSQLYASTGCAESPIKACVTDTIYFDNLNAPTAITAIQKDGGRLLGADQRLYYLTDERVYVANASLSSGPYKVGMQVTLDPSGKSVKIAGINSTGKLAVIDDKNEVGYDWTPADIRK